LAQKWPEIRFSALYSTAPREYEEQDTFINAVAYIETDDPPDEVANALNKIERNLGKKTPFRYGPRTIDLDLLLYGDEVISSDRLTVPHPHMHERRFVLEPLCELIDPKKIHPTMENTWEYFLGDVENQKCERRDETN